MDQVKGVSQVFAFFSLFLKDFFKKHNRCFFVLYISSFLTFFAEIPHTMPRYDNFFGKYLFGNHLVAKILSYACRILSSLAFSIDSAKAVRTNLKK